MNLPLKRVTPVSLEIPSRLAKLFWIFSPLSQFNAGAKYNLKLNEVFLYLSFSFQGIIKIYIKKKTFYGKKLKNVKASKL